ncbi:MAG: hypothetical protein Fur0032_15270 [Terrimicrobiaceae bacterium]
MGAPEWLLYNEKRKDEGGWEADDGSNDWGGFYWMALAYYTRGAGTWPVPNAIQGSTVTEMGGGPVLNSHNALNAFPISTIEAKENLSAVLPPAAQTLDYQAREIFFLDQKGSGRNQSQQVAAIKQALQTYGALTTYVNADAKGFGDGQPFVYRGGKPFNHGLTIIGWDDDIVIQGRKGAWLVQNSWGSGWAQGGTTYASYFDKYVGKAGIMAVQMAEMGDRSQTVLQNELGPLDVFQTRGSANPLGMAILPQGRTRSRNEVASVISVDEATTLMGLGLASHIEGAGVSFSIYSGFDAATGPIGSPLYTSGSLSFSGRGYQVFDLQTPISLAEGSQLVVVVDYMDRKNVVPYVLGGTTGDVGSGLSFFRSPRGWQDFASLGRTSGVFFMKGVVGEPVQPSSLSFDASTVPEPGSVALVSLAFLWSVWAFGGRMGRRWQAGQ